jgi:hypothetical protein
MITSDSAMEIYEMVTQFIFKPFLATHVSPTNFRLRLSELASERLRHSILPIGICALDPHLIKVRSKICAFVDKSKLLHQILLNQHLRT